MQSTLFEISVPFDDRGLNIGYGACRKTVNMTGFLIGGMFNSCERTDRMFFTRSATDVLRAADKHLQCADHEDCCVQFTSWAEAHVTDSVWRCAVVVVALFVAGVSGLVSAQDARPARNLIVFSAMGDVPYAPEEYLTLKDQLTELPKESQFVVHVGDIKTGASLCTEDVYESVSAILAKAPCPLFILVGDNEWNDCANPGDAWALWMKYFTRFDDKWKHNLAVKRQENRTENFAFVRSEVLFIGINVVGGRVHDEAEWKQRHADDLKWTRLNLEQYRDSIRSTVIFGHAFPVKVHDDYFKGLNDLVKDFNKPVLYLHGDGHRWIRDRPFANKGILRIQVDQGRIGPPLKITVTDDPKDPFVVDRRKADE